MWLQGVLTTKVAQRLVWLQVRLSTIYFLFAWSLVRENGEFLKTGFSPLTQRVALNCFRNLVDLWEGWELQFIVAFILSFFLHLLLYNLRLSWFATAIIIIARVQQDDVFLFPFGLFLLSILDEFPLDFSEDFVVYKR